MSTDDKKSEHKQATKKVHPPHTHQPVRLYVKAAFVGFRRSIVFQRENQSVLQIEGVQKRDDTAFYLGKRVAFIYRASTLRSNRKQKVSPNKYRVIWGRIARAHGNNGLVRAHFRHNLPPNAMGATVRVMLFPSNI